MLPLGGMVNCTIQDWKDATGGIFDDMRTGQGDSDDVLLYADLPMRDGF